MAAVSVRRSSKKDNNLTLLIIEIKDMLRSINENRRNKK